MKFTSILVIVLLQFIGGAAAQIDSTKVACPVPEHAAWTRLLQHYVDSSGWVDYGAFAKDTTTLNVYLDALSNCPPAANWTELEKLAYWINVYNAFTVKLILDNYPVESIKDIRKGVPRVNSVWEMEFFKIGQQSMSLSKVEHGILRKEFKEPRIHFAIVCASISCPQLRNEAYEADGLESQLDDQSRRFINDRSKNQIDQDQIRISQIFKWFKSDFTHDMSIKEFIAQFSESELDKNAKLKYLQYDWKLNGE